MGHVMQSPVIYPLFSAPVYVQFGLEFNVSDNTLKELEQLPGLGPDCGLSQNIDVLDRPDLANIRNLCEQHLQLYVENICGYDNDIRITTSWMSRNPPGVDHPPHNHPNSLFSGCLYLKSSPDNKFNLHGQNHFTKHWPFTYNIKTNNIYNSDDWWIPVDTGTLVIFPSNLQHSAGPNQLDETRVVLCFNSFIKGTLGGSGDFAARLKL